jgi:hypothetical protein
VARTIQEVLDTILAAVPGAPFPGTVDTVKAGDPSREVTGIVVAFLATCEVVEKAVQLGANLIIAHEPVFYNNLDATDWLRKNRVYDAKRDLIEKNRLVIWRFHDYLHSLPPDSTLMGLLETLGWEEYVLPAEPFFCRIPPLTLRQIGQRVRDLVRGVCASWAIRI